mmetsp:Transcript_39033/g.110563  ORF Transcript_39033/g.110563 Transcript_39033/m.110563 type:complete len:170 (-) Transcript_39033:171-680(-)
MPAPPPALRAATSCCLHDVGDYTQPWCILTALECPGAVHGSCSWRGCGLRAAVSLPCVQMIRNAWHLSGGEGWCENTTCRRVLVTHGDGHQTVEEITNDMDIGMHDNAAMLANLRARGIDAAAVAVTNAPAVSAATLPAAAAGMRPRTSEERPASARKAPAYLQSSIQF